MIDAVHRQYYQSVRQLFEDFKVRCDHPDEELELEPPVPPISAPEWQHALRLMQAAHDAEDPALHVITVPKARALDFFRGKEAVWVTCFMLLVFAVLFVRAWPHLDPNFPFCF